MNLPIFKTGAELRQHLLPFRAKKIALVPTMGALHEGHLELARRAAKLADHVIVYVFVNPAQFAPHEDFAAYPRDLARDAHLVSGLNLKSASLFAPTVPEIYPDVGNTQIMLGDIALRWEGAARPTHFTGVALVLTKFFNIVRPDVVCMGEKDFQQLQVVRQLVHDFSFPIEIIGVPTLREPSGLAMSSRNAYLTAEEREIAPRLYAALQDAAQKIRKGGDISQILSEQVKNLYDFGFEKVDYFVCVDAKTLAPHVQSPPTGGRLLAAAKLGRVRLLDNIAVD